MKIECKNINDFCELVNISVATGITAKCIFSSQIQHNSSNCFVLLTPLYTAIYSGADDNEQIKELCLKQDIHIHSFERLNYISETDSLILSNKIETI